jgi:hypothetical protein
MKISPVRKILESYGPLLSSRIIKILHESGLSQDAARQRIARRPKDIRSLYGLTFPKNARFLFLESQFNTEQYWESLLDAMKESNSAYHITISSLLGHGGAVFKSVFDIISGAPILQKNQISSSSIFNKLESIGIIKTFNIDGDEVVVLNEKIPGYRFNYPEFKGRFLIQNLVIDAIVQWAGRLNIVSPGVAKVRSNDELPKYGTFCFDICGPSYLLPLKSFKMGKLVPGFFVADIISGNELNKNHVTYFIKKCGTSKSLKNLPPFIPMLIADYFTAEALHSCRAEGIIATTPRTLFGEDVADALRDLLRTLSNAAAMASANPGKIESIFNRLSAIEGAAGNLRGALFELIVGHMVRSLEGGSIDIGEIVVDYNKNKRAEIDVRLVKERIVTIYECKGYQPNAVISIDEVNHWLNDRVPLIYSAHGQESRFQNSRFSFEFWTCGSFESDALEMLKKAKEKTRKYSISWKDGEGVLSYSKQLQASGIRKIINEHYLKHPLTKIG